MNSRHIAFLATCAFQCLASHAPSQNLGSREWVSLGLDRERTTVLVVGDNAPGLLLAGSSSDFSAGTVGGVFRSNNQGETWDTLIRGFSVSCIVIHPQSSDTIFVGTGTANYSVPGILKTTDAGGTWTWANQGIFLDWQTSILSIAIDPHVSNIMYAGTGGTNGGALYRTTDGGRHWNMLNPPSDNGYSKLQVLPGDSGVLLVGTSSGILRSPDRGDSWSIPVEDVDEVLDLQSDATGQIVFAGLGRYAPYGFAKSFNAGMSWTYMSNVDTVNHGIFSIAIDPNNPRTVFLITAGSGRHLLKSLDGGISWEPLPNPAALPRIAIYSPRSGDLYVGCDKMDSLYGGVFKLNISTAVRDHLVDTDLPNFDTYPNPFNSELKLRLRLSEKRLVNLQVFNLLGEVVWNLGERSLEAGSHEWSWQAMRKPSGLYFCRVQVGSQFITNKVLLIR